VPINQNLRCNEQIRISPVRLIGEDNEQLGIMTNNEAIRLAREAGLDVVEVAPNVRPPVCRLMDYGKWKYNQKKKVKKTHEQSLKQVRLRPKTDTHDREIKLKKAIRFFKKGHKVQFTMVFRGRERFRREVGMGIFHSIIEEFGERVKVERPPSMEGRLMVMILTAQKSAFDDVVDAGDLQDEDDDDALEIEDSDALDVEDSDDQDAGDGPDAAAEQPPSASDATAAPPTPEVPETPKVESEQQQ
jgi:translation initiation factor IF-3